MYGLEFNVKTVKFFIELKLSKKRWGVFKIMSDVYNTTNNLYWVFTNYGKERLVSLSADDHLFLYKAGIGCYKYWQGKKRSRETTEKILKTLKVRRVRCIETGEIYQSALYATRVVHGDVNRCVKGERKTAAGYHWEYVD